MKSTQGERRRIKIPFQPVAPEHTSLASNRTIEGGEGFPSTKKYAVETPARPAPIMTISHSVGSSAELLWLSISWSSVRQYGKVAFATGNGFDAAMTLERTDLGVLVKAAVTLNVVKQEGSRGRDIAMHVVARAHHMPTPYALPVQ